ncbi:hypothetical protein JCM19275_1061 [Nonlabens ulvanivorans]|uniref:DUF2971 domain-containing protein n=1 Tax=Nonlabens ulvanivorans TaxID=906888 RepID=A0A090X2X1_NONUL|nr:hypothetical protein JCM19275_1061 [Nonlabens ulvanivorans]
MIESVRLNKFLRNHNMSIDEFSKIITHLNLDIELRPTAKIDIVSIEFIESYLRIKKDDKYLSKQNDKFDYSKSTEGVLLRLRKLKPQPKTIFKYYSNDEKGLNLDALKNKYLYHSSFKSFNDPFDCNINLVSFRKNGKFKKTQKKKKDLFKNKLNNVGICCFTTKKDSILMWSHYSNSHKGYCLEFMKKEEELYPVNYIKDFNKTNYYDNIKDSEFHLTYSKSEEWSYENEYRSIVDNIDPTNPNSRKRKYSPHRLKSVYFGVNASDKLKLQIIEILKENYVNFKEIELYENHLKENSFGIESVKIN